MKTTPIHYSYVGPRSILAQTNLHIGGELISSLSDIRHWLKERTEDIFHGALTATFIITTEEKLRISGRHTEHVMCAQGKEVLAAGEITFQLEGKEIYVSEITNQSTGYCPEPSCWTVVDKVLSKIGISYPKAFTMAFEFRRCDACQHINLIKDEGFECGVCGAELDANWNFW